MRDQARLQRDHYTATARDYDALHVSEGDEHSVALRYASAIMREFELHSLLDVGTGTGRAVGYFRRMHAGALVVGVEPVLALLARARVKPDIAGAHLASASGYCLPFRSASFDAVCQFGILHHVKDPNGVVAEMMRVARRAVFLSDSNRFGQGPLPSRLIKLLLFQCRLWPLANFLKTRGSGYTVSDGDGVSYSYSVFDSLNVLQRWADRVVLVPTGRPDYHNWCSPLLTSSHVLLCAVRGDR
ncbi:MAG: class I SAM-dependent methyltransferase [Chloroflexota bacterium]|nr:class I SAM-dependent methyltransferase [Chloroflexota bacterium]